MARLTRTAAAVAASVVFTSMLAVVTSRPASAAPSAISVTSPLTNQVVQRDVATGAADVSVTGTLDTSGPVEASLDGVNWTPMTVEGTTFAGVLQDQPIGRRDLVVRSVEAPTVSKTVPGVGVGDVFAVMGDSNASAPSAIPQAYTGPGGQVSMFTQLRVWRTVTGDPIDRADEDAPLANCRWILFVCVHHALYDPYVGGSTWPRVATLLANAQPGLPIGLVVMAKGGSILNCDPAVSNPVCWQNPVGAWGNDPFQSLYADALNRLRAMAPPGGVRAMVWFEGFVDTGATKAASGRAQYLSRLNRFVSNLQSDYGPLDVIVSSPGDCDIALSSKCLDIEPGLDNVRSGVADAWASIPGVRRGPVLYDIDKSSGATSDGIHYRDQVALEAAADRLAGALLTAYYGGPSQVGPQLVSATGDEASVRLTFDQAELTPGAPVGGITVERDGVALPMLSVAAASNHEVDVALPGQDGTLTVSIAAGRSGRQAGIVRGANGLPADPVLRAPVQRTDPDVTGPAGAVTINGGAAQVTSASVSLTLGVSDDRTPAASTEMQVSNAADLAGATWQPYTASLPWTLDAGTGTRTVYARFRDAAGNTSAVVSDTIEVGAPSMGPVRYIGGALTLQGGAFAANVRPADFFRLRGTVYIDGVAYTQRNDVTRCGTSCVQGSAFALFRPNQAWNVDLAAGTVTVNGISKAITSGTLTIT